VTDVDNPQQGGKKGEDNNKNLYVLVDVRIMKINNSMATLNRQGGTSGYAPRGARVHGGL